MTDHDHVDHRPPAHDDGAGHEHGNHHHGVSAEADRGWLSGALGLIVVFMAGEVAIGLWAHSLALLSDAAHMLTDAAAIVLALVAMRLAARPPRGGYTFGLKRAEILSAQANGVTLLVLSVWLTIEAVGRLVHPPAVAGRLVLYTALVGVVINFAATWCLSRANRTSLNVRGAYLHILTDLFAFIATAIAGLTMVLTGYTRADAIASLVVVALMVKAGIGLVTESGRIFMEAAPTGLDPADLGRDITAIDGVTEVHDLHVWQVTSGYPAASAHVLVDPSRDCHEVRRDIAALLDHRYHIEHTTLQVDHADTHDSAAVTALGDHCTDPHGVSYHADLHRPGHDRQPEPVAEPGHH